MCLVVEDPHLNFRIFLICLLCLMITMTAMMSRRAPSTASAIPMASTANTFALLLAFNSGKSALTYLAQLLAYLFTKICLSASSELYVRLVSLLTKASPVSDSEANQKQHSLLGPSPFRSLYIVDGFSPCLLVFLVLSCTSHIKD